MYISNTKLKNTRKLTVLSEFSYYLCANISNQDLVILKQLKDLWDGVPDRDMRLSLKYT